VGGELSKYYIEQLHEGSNIIWRHNNILLKLNLNVERLIDENIRIHINRIKQIITIFHSDKYLELAEEGTSRKVIENAINQETNNHIDEKIVIAYNKIKGTHFTWQLYCNLI
jgi:hypothetical protein